MVRPSHPEALSVLVHRRRTLARVTIATLLEGSLFRARHSIPASGCARRLEAQRAPIYTDVLENQID